MLNTETLHPALFEIVDTVKSKGYHSSAWAPLRTSHFPGPTGFDALKAWCAELSIECSIGFSQSSKVAMVDFRRRKANAA